MFGKRIVFISVVTIFCCTLFLASMITFAQTDSEEQKTTTALDWWEKVFIPLFQNLIWPLLVLVVIFSFRPQIMGLIKRMQRMKVKTPVGEMEIVGTDNLEEAENLAKAASKVMNASIADTQGFIERIEQEEGRPPTIVGNPDRFQLLTKVESARLERSTKVMNVPTGCIVQVTTKERGQNGQISVAEALTFVPDLNVTIEKDTDGKLLQAEFVKLG